MNKYSFLMSGIVLLSFAIAIYLYPQMPELMASHWNAAGQALATDLLSEFLAERRLVPAR